MKRLPRRLVRSLILIAAVFIMVAPVAACSGDGVASSIRGGISSLAGKTTTTQAPLTSEEVSSLSKQLGPSVVGVEAVISTTKSQVLESVGTGIVYSTTGYIVTNNHVVTKEDGGPSKSIKVTLSSGKKYTATIVARDPSADIAVLHVSASNLKPAPLRTDLSNLEPGDQVVAIGNSSVLSAPVTTGRVIKLVNHPRLEGLVGLTQVIESSVPLANGNSGGPLADAEGNVIGMNSAKITSEGTALSIPASLMVKIVNELLERD